VLPAQPSPNITRPGTGLPPRAPVAYNPPQSAAPHGQADPRLQRQPYPVQQQRPAAPGQTQSQFEPHAQFNRPQRGGLIRALTGQDAASSQGIPPQNIASQRDTRPAAPDASQQSLYGHLNDDVAAPKVLNAEDFDIPSDQPIPTVQSVPVKPVNREAFAGLAGG